MRVVKEIAERESCIFVGHCADCVKWVKMTKNIIVQEAEMMIIRADKIHSEYYHHFTDGR